MKAEYPRAIQRIDEPETTLTADKVQNAARNAIEALRSTKKPNAA